MRTFKAIKARRIYISCGLFGMFLAFIGYNFQAWELWVLIVWFAFHGCLSETTDKDRFKWW